MDNIVRNFEEIELTEAELEVIYGAQGCVSLDDVSGLFNMSGTYVALLGTSTLTTTNVVASTFTKSVQ